MLEATTKTQHQLPCRQTNINCLTPDSNGGDAATPTTRETQQAPPVAGVDEKGGLVFFIDAAANNNGNGNGNGNGGSASPLSSASTDPVPSSSPTNSPNSRGGNQQQDRASGGSGGSDAARSSEASGGGASSNSPPSVKRDPRDPWGMGKTRSLCGI